MNWSFVRDPIRECMQTYLDTCIQLLGDGSEMAWGRAAGGGGRLAVLPTCLFLSSLCTPAEGVLLPVLFFPYERRRPSLLIFLNAFDASIGDHGSFVLLAAVVLLLL